MMSLWTRNPKPRSCLSSLPLKKTLCPSSVVVSPKFFHLISQSPQMFHLYLSISCVSSWSFPAAIKYPCVSCANGDVVSSTNLQWYTSSMLDTSVLEYSRRWGPCWPRWRLIQYSMVAGSNDMESHGQGTTWQSPSLSRLNKWPLSSP